MNKIWEIEKNMKKKVTSPLLPEAVLKSVNVFVSSLPGAFSVLMCTEVFGFQSSILSSPT